MSAPPGTLWVVRMVEERFHRDDEDRPLREGRTPPEYLSPGQIEYRPCPYPGSRQVAGHAMNVSALRQTSAHWDEIVESLAFLRTAYAEARGGYGPDVMDLWRVSQLGSALPWFFLLAGEPLPAYAAALSKATLGTGILAQRLMLKMLAEAWMPPRSPHRRCWGSPNRPAPWSAYLDQLVGEPEQWVAIGWVNARLYTVVYEERTDASGDYYHLVTLWRSTIAERKRYEENQ